jgi:cell division protease FtsH
MQFDRVWRMVLVWVLVALALLLIRPSSATRGEQISYSQFSREVSENNIASVVVAPQDNQVAGVFRKPITVNGRDVPRFQTRLPFTDMAPLINQLDANGVGIEVKAPRSGWISMVVAMLPWLLIIGLWFFMIRRIQPGGQQALAFGKSGAAPIGGDTPKVTFDDVAGADEAKAELTEVIEFLRDPSKFQRLGGRLPKGVLLVGPPGTGKTLLARAVAGEAGRPFFSMSGSDFVEMFVGVGASRVRDLFAKGKANAPCIIFVDELDAVGRQRGAGLGGGHDEREQTLNQLLVELDGFQPKEGVILLAATNRPDVLDPALLRPGRFDRQIVVDLPDVLARQKILAVHARKIPLDENVDLAIIARGTPGLSGADLANITNEAALFAARRNEDRVSMRDMEDAKDKVMLGAERTSLVLTPEERELAAYHESGHALVNLLTPGLDPVYKVTIVPRGRALGITFALPEADRRNLTKAYLEGRLAVAYGGRIAEEVVFGPEQVTTGAAQDYQQATDLARQMVTQFGMSDVVGPVTLGDREEVVFLGRELAQRHGVSERTARLIDEEVRRLASDAYARARAIVVDHREALDRLAAALLEKETLNREECETLVFGHAGAYGDRGVPLPAAGKPTPSNTDPAVNQTVAGGAR